MKQKIKIVGGLLWLGLSLTPQLGHAEIIRASTAAAVPIVMQPVQDPNRVISAEPAPITREAVPALPIDSKNNPVEVQPGVWGEVAKDPGPSSGQGIEAPNSGQGSGVAPQPAGNPTDPSQALPQQPVAEETNQGQGSEVSSAILAAPAFASEASGSSGAATSETFLSGAGCSMVPSTKSSQPTFEAALLLAGLASMYRKFLHKPKPQS